MVVGVCPGGIVFEVARVSESLEQIEWVVKLGNPRAESERIFLGMQFLHEAFGIELLELDRDAEVLFPVLLQHLGNSPIGLRGAKVEDKPFQFSLFYAEFSQGFFEQAARARRVE